MAYPRCAQHQLQWHYCKHPPRQENGLRIPEPLITDPSCDIASLDVLLMPLIAFDALGNRLGSGQGYYDRALHSLPKNQCPRLIGLAFSCQYSPEPLPQDAHDISVDGVCTEEGFFFTPAKT